MASRIASLFLKANTLPIKSQNSGPVEENHQHHPHKWRAQWLLPFLTNSQKERRVSPATGNHNWGNSCITSLQSRQTFLPRMNWRGKESGERRGAVIATQCTSRFPASILRSQWCGTSADGQRDLHYLGPNEARMPWPWKIQKQCSFWGYPSFRSTITRPQFTLQGSSWTWKRGRGVRRPWAAGQTWRPLKMHLAGWKRSWEGEGRPSKRLAHKQAEVKATWDSYLRTLCFSRPNASELLSTVMGK